ncbi:hypothetical protein HAX54_041239 [Datura stramonium]|uniref:Leucine-rich repeat-containing N-terminal plant-type domain-containing protein n=1 Tax=Datura stramonium TaxID=4076 RepID=A0ABS8VQF4_DATST|nr:hypothetical protein [Datura stramonium]
MNVFYFSIWMLNRLSQYLPAFVFVMRNLNVLCLFIFLSLKSVAISFRSASGNSTIKCIEKERQILVRFKQGLEDEFGLLSSWGSEENKRECCKWRGVKCNNHTGHVVALDLHRDSDNNIAYKPLRGNIGPSLLELEHLSYLDLSDNEFLGTPIPKFIGSLRSLQYLNLSATGFFGLVPDQLGNLSNLRILDLSRNYALSINSLEWISRISSLRYISLSHVDLSNATDWLHSVSKLPLLKELHLGWCGLPVTSPFSFLSRYNFSISSIDLSGNSLKSPSRYHWLFNLSSTLTDVNLSENEMEGPIPDAFGKIISLKHLNLSINKLEGGVPKAFGNLSNLRSLDLSLNNLSAQLSQVFLNLSGQLEYSLQMLILSGNKLKGPLPDNVKSFSSLRELLLFDNLLNGSIPESFLQLPNLEILDLSWNQLRGSLPNLYRLTSLKELYLDNNRLTGSLPESISCLSKIRKIYLSSNSLEGLVSEVHLSNLSLLQHLDISNNSLVLKFNPTWLPPFQLDVIRLAHCRVGPSFPKWLQSQKYILELDISGSGISDVVPSWFWDLSPKLELLNLSYNNLGGELPDLSLKFGKFPRLDLSSNNFTGLLPEFPSSSTSLILSKNKFQGPLSFICRSSGSLSILDLSDNLLSGQLPDCWMDFKQLAILNLANNRFHGNVPKSIGSLSEVQALHLRYNGFTGELPNSLKQCTLLRILDLGKNKLTGKIPEWIGDSLSDLVVLSLRSNEFHGHIPSQICQLQLIQILDLSLNNISGSIPHCLKNFTAMTAAGSLNSTITHSYYYASGSRKYDYTSYADSALLLWKGTEFEYKNTLGLVRSIDLSSNRISGEIPAEIASLVGLVALNLSRNNLTGRIPAKIGDLRLLNFLDFASNHLFGGIPQSFSQLNYLGVLDLSNNNLSGKIPLSTQLQSFNASAYAGNLGLCGLPLARICSENQCCRVPTVTEDDSGDEGFISPGFYAGAALGFVVSFWGVCGPLLFNSSWAFAYYRFLDNMKNWFVATPVFVMAKLKRWFPG